ncbi:MAG: hypothetical protein ABIK09_20700 [Pseudomonadota bacterium]
MRSILILTVLMAFVALPAQATQTRTDDTLTVSCDKCGCKAKAEGDKPCGCKGECPGDCPKKKDHKEEMQKLLTGELGLDAAKADKVGAVLNDSMMKKRKAKKEKHAAFDALEQLVEAKEAKVEAYEAALKRLHDANDAFGAAKMAGCDALGKLLDAKQIATLKVHMMKAHGEGHHGCKGDGGCKGDCGCKGDGECKGDGSCKKGKKGKKGKKD